MAQGGVGQKKIVHQIQFVLIYQKIWHIFSLYTYYGTWRVRQKNGNYS